MCAILLTSGCGELDYYLHLANGQMRILLHRRDIADVIADAATDEHVRQRLLLIGQIREFARTHVGLDGESSSYTVYYDTGGDPIAWNVSASPPDRFEAYRWTFPIVGDLPYKGFFTRERALVERDRLIADGYDAIAGPVAAYSLLGYLADPVLSTMLQNSEGRLVDLVLHELTHATIYVEQHTDYNESLASFIGRAGSLQFLQQRYGEGSSEVEQVRQQRADAAAFRAFLVTVTARLDSLYNSAADRDTILSQREELFEQSQQEYRQQRDRLGGGRHDGFLQWQVNNARLLSYRRYNRSMEDFDRVLRLLDDDLPSALAVFVECGQSDQPFVCVKEWHL